MKNSKISKFSSPLESNINVTPFIDVMLVLLIIFIITSPMITQGIKVNLPDSKGSSTVQDEKNSISIIVTKEGNIVIGNNTIDVSTIAKHIQHLAKDMQDPSIFLHGDKEVLYGTIAKIVDALRHAGFNKVSLITGDKGDTRTKNNN